VVLGVLVLSLVITLLARLWYIQVLAAPTYRQAALDNQVRDIVTEAPRGEILDDQGRPLVDNKTALVVSVDRTALASQPDGGKAVLHRLAKKLHLSYTHVTQEIRICGTPLGHNHYVGKPCWPGSGYQPIPVSQLSPNLKATRQALQIEEMKDEFPGVTVQLAAVRNYPKRYGALASAILGYIQPISPQQLAKLSKNQQDIQRSTEVGATGLEAQYERYLHGKPGLKQVTVNHLEDVTGTIRDTSPVPGDDVVTNIDAKAQADLEGQLRAALNNSPAAEFAAGVVLNARNGGVVAMASDPTYNPSQPPPKMTGKQYKHLLHQPGSPLFDKAFQAAEPPGSTFKMISSAGLLYDGTISPGGSYDCPTTFQNRHSFEYSQGLGFIPLQTAIEVSCDTYFFELGYDDYKRDQALIAHHKKPREGVQHMARDLGLGESPGIDLPNATFGHIPDRKNTKLEWEQSKQNYCEGAKRRPKGSYLQQLDHDYCVGGYIFYPGDQENEDVGQGTVTASPLQMAVAYAALANGGTVFEPRVAKAIVSPSGKVIKRIKAPVRDHIPLSKSTLDYLRSCFYAVTTGSRGTATAAFAGFPMNKVLVGGKTGTAELPHTSNNDAWFVSFGGPAGQKPQFVTVIEVYKGDQGAISAAPFVRNMWDDLYGFGGKQAIFPNGVPPTKLPTIGSHGNVAPKQHKHPAGPITTTTPGTSGTTTSSTSPTLSTMGAPDAVEPRRASGGAA
jgi:penicillin-binding protein 2